jgi:hypothetical protein
VKLYRDPSSEMKSKMAMENRIPVGFYGSSPVSVGRLQSQHTVDAARDKHHSKGFTKMYKSRNEVNPTIVDPCLLKPAHIDPIALSSGREFTAPAIFDNLSHHISGFFKSFDLSSFQLKNGLSTPAFAPSRAKTWP